MAAPSPLPSSGALTRRRRLGRQEREAEILGAAMQVFSVREASTVTVDEIAEHAGVSRALVYEYFGDRSKLLHEVTRRFARRFSERLNASVDEADGSARQLLISFVGAHLSFAADGPEAYRLALADPSGGVDWLGRYFGGTPDARLVAAASAEALRAFVLQWAQDRQVPMERAQELAVSFVSGGLVAVRPLGVRAPSRSEWPGWRDGVVRHPPDRRGVSLDEEPSDLQDSASA